MVWLYFFCSLKVSLFLVWFAVSLRVAHYLFVALFAVDDVCSLTVAIFIPLGLNTGQSRPWI